MIREAIEKDGFAIVPNVVTAESMDAVLEGIAQSNARRSRAGVRRCLNTPAVAAMANDPTVLNIAQDVLGPRAFPYSAVLFDKSPQANWLVVWHQDTALPLTERKDVSGWGPWSVKEGSLHAHAPTTALNRVLALRIHLDDCTSQNGPLLVLPGTHKLGVIDDDKIHALAGSNEPLACAVPRGGVLAMRPLLVHSSSKSQDETSRRVLHIEYAASKDAGDGLKFAVV